MKKAFIYIFLISSTAYFSACQQKMICPAYHSYFILDVDETKKKFTLFGDDSLPRKNWDVDKEKYGIAKDIPDQKKLKEIRIISMNSIYNKLEDPFENFQHQIADYDYDSMIFIDSAALMAQNQDYNDFQNIDQMIYLHHFGKYIPKKGAGRDMFKEDLKQEDQPLISEEDIEDGNEPKKKRKLWPFGKKNKKSEEVERIDEEDL